MKFIDLSSCIHEAWEVYGSKNTIIAVNDISAKVSTNLVFRVVLSNNTNIIAKASLFGEYEHFVYDHKTINILSNNLLYPFENFLAKSLIKNNKVFIHKTSFMNMPIWVVFYNPIRVQKFFPKLLTIDQVKDFGREMGKFHSACENASEHLPKSKKTMRGDVLNLLNKLKDKSSFENFYFKKNKDIIREHCFSFLENIEHLDFYTIPKIPVFVDWNIGNFSLNDKNEFYSRWDYDWFRIAPKVLDFYFCSRVVSSIGDKTIFSYSSAPIHDERFIIFLESYMQVNTITPKEILLMKEIYRFFILNYVIHHGKRFFHDLYSSKLQKEAFAEYLPHIDNNLQPEKILARLKI